MNTDTQSQTSQLAVGVGVTGHRDLSEDAIDSVKGSAAAVFQIVRDVISAGRPDIEEGKTGPPILRVVSGLAQGADQTVTERAIETGFVLNAVLPFDRDTYGKDFADYPQAFDRYRELLGRAETVFELNGPSLTPEETWRSYKAVGSIILAHTDLLVAVWDGQGPAGRGGTADVINMALEQRIPVVWIDAKAPHDTQLLIVSHGRRRSTSLDELKPVLQRLLEPVDSDSEKKSLSAFLEEVSSARMLWRAWRRVYRLVSHAFLQVVTGGRSVAKKRSASPPRGRYKEHFERVNELAISYAELYRSSFLINYMFGALAVTFALLAYALGTWESSFVLAELAVIVLMAANVRAAKRGRWQERATDYRLLAEQFRQMVFLDRLGKVSPYPRPQPYHRTDPNETWMRRYFRNVVRTMGLLECRLDWEYLRRCRELIYEDLIMEQLAYHRDTGERYHRLEKRLYRFAVVMFALTALACTAHLMRYVPVFADNHLVEWLHHHSSWLTVFAAALPAWGAASHAIGSQAEAKSLSDRSSAMVEAIAEFENVVGHVPGNNESETAKYSLELLQYTENLATVMLDEVVDWRVAYQLPDTVLA